MPRNTKEKYLEWFLPILLILLGIYIAIQILRIILGGSWAVEDVILALLIFNLGLTGFILRISTGNKHDLRNLERSFRSLADDFKKHRDNKKEHR